MSQNAAPPGSAPLTTAGIPHVLMTRFNLATPGREATIRNRPDWLADRFDLFETFCLPSVAAQTVRDFTWIIYFDKDTPQVFQDRIKALQREVPFEAYFTGLFPASGWPRSLAEVLGRMPDTVLTSRLDNDDALACDYMERTAAAAVGCRPDPRIGIVITQGHIRCATRVYALSHRCNAFTSWLERTEGPDGPLTAMGIAHMDARLAGPLVQVPGPSGWLQVVHGDNVSNKVRGRLVAPETLAGRYHPDSLKGLAPVSPITLGVDNALLQPLRAGRDKALALVRGVRRRLRSA